MEATLRSNSARSALLRAKRKGSEVRSHRLLIVGVALLASAGVLLILALPIINRAVELPYDSSNPVIYDNDDTVDVYTDDYLMALASAGDITLVGMITTTSVAPYNKHVPATYFEKAVADRKQGVVHARNSGFRNIPDPIRGVKRHLRTPPSGQIADTRPVGSEGSWLIVKEAKKATTEKPLVVAAGGPLTTVADAYLLDSSIADRVIVAWLGGDEHGMADYNGWADPWAGYIVLQRLRLVQFPVPSLKPTWKDLMVLYLQKVKFFQFSTDAAPYIPKSRLATLPSTPLRQWMIDKDHPSNSLPGDMDADGPPAISLSRRDYVLKVKKISFSHWRMVDGHEIPAFREDPSSKDLVVQMARKDVATEEWLRALGNPAAYHRN